jgi:hypothetical protein
MFLLRSGTHEKENLKLWHGRRKHFLGGIEGNKFFFQEHTRDLFIFLWFVVTRDCKIKPR